MSDKDVYSTISRICRVGQLLTGHAYLRQLVENMARELDIAYVFIGEADEVNQESIHTLELWAKSRIIDNIEYRLAGTPCQEVLTGNRICIHPANAAAEFPDDPLLQEMNVETYMGAPITRSSGEVVGLLVALDTKPRHDTEKLAAVLEFFSGRAGAELERSAWEKAMRVSNEKLETRVKERTEELRHAQDNLVEMARKTGMADIASYVLHNIGNILTGARISAEEIGQIVDSKSLYMLSRVNDLMANHHNDLGSFLTNDTKGKKIPTFYREVEKNFRKDYDHLKKESENLQRQVQAISEVVARQQEYAGGVVRKKPGALDLVETTIDVVEMMGASFRRNAIEVVLDTPKIALACADSSRVVQILGNLLKNAVEELKECDERNIYVTLQEESGDLKESPMVYLNVRDSGRGISLKDQSRIFVLGYSNKQAGHGIGLHASVIMAEELGGELTLIETTSPPAGAHFRLALPQASKEKT